MSCRALFAIAACVAAILSARPASALDTDPGAARDGAPALVHVRAAVHRGVVVGDAIQWRSTLAVDREGETSRVRVRMAVPLPPGETLDDAPSVRAVADGGRIVAVDLDPSLLDALVVLRFTQPTSAQSEKSTHLGAPLAAGDAVQIVDVAGEGGARFEPNAILGLDRYVNELVQPGVSQSDREAAATALDFRPPIGAVPLFLRADTSLVARGGIDGTLTTFSERRHGAAAGAGVAFALVIAGLWALQRRLARVAREEEADRVIAAEYQALDPEGDRA